MENYTIQKSISPKEQQGGYATDNDNQQTPAEDLFYSEAFSRNLGLLSRSEQELLRNSKIAIPGMGGVGGLHLINLVRLGVGNFHIADFDSFEVANINRQYGAKVSNLHQSKVHVMAKEAKEVNPYVHLQVFETAITQDNIDAFLKDVDVVVDSIDFFNVQARRLLFNKAREKGIHVITAGPIGYSTAMLIFSPGKMSFDSYFDIQEGMTEKEMVFRFGIGLCPKATQLSYMDMTRVSFENKKGPSLNLACQLCTAAAATEVIRILLHPEKVKAAPHYFQYDLWTTKFIKGYLLGGNKNPIQKLKIIFLKRKLNIQETELKNKVVSTTIDPRHTTTINSTVLNTILQAGTLAPSADNAQPWKYKVNGNEIGIHLDKQGETPFYAINQIASLISCGAVVENMRIAAAARYINTSVCFPASTLNESRSHEEVVRLVVEKDTAIISDNLYPFLEERHTNRTTYSQKEIPGKDLQKLASSIGNIENVSLQLITKGQEKNRIAELVYEADIIRTENKEIHEHLIKMIRYNTPEALKTRDGFHIKNLEAGLHGELFLKFVKSWKRMNFMNKLGAGKKMAEVSKVAIESCSAVGIIKTQDNTIADLINAGRAMQRIWLRATSLGIDFQPLSAITLFWMNNKYGKENAFNTKHQTLLTDLWHQYKDLLNINGREEPIFLFRIGYGKQVKVKTLRKELAEFKL